MWTATLSRRFYGFSHSIKQRTSTIPTSGKPPLYSVSVLELDCGQEFDASRDEDFFAALPPRPAVCLIEPHAQNAEPLLIRTQDLRKRMQRLLGPLDPTT